MLTVGHGKKPLTNPFVRDYLPTPYGGTSFNNCLIELAVALVVSVINLAGSGAHRINVAQWAFACQRVGACLKVRWLGRLRVRFERVDRVAIGAL